MKVLHQRVRSKSNASLISMMQRFSDISMISIGLYIVCLVNYQEFSHKCIIAILISLVCFQMIGGITDFYRSWRGVKIYKELNIILQNWTLSLILTAGITSLFFDLEIALKVYMQWYFIVCISSICCRVAIRFIIRVIRNQGYNTCRVAIAGSMPIGIYLMRSFAEEPWLGFIGNGVYNDAPIREDEDIKYAGDFSQLITDARNGELDRIYIAMRMGDESKIKELVKKLSDTTCSVMLIPDVFTLNILQSRTEEVNGVPVVPLFDTPLNGINMVLKRLEDIVLSLIILILIAPVLIIIACAIKFTSPGPVIFRQTRYGMDGKPINVWKFRSMNVMENGAFLSQATKDDARVTEIGAFLRRTSLDELPQFFNVLFGKMSIVGPRPHAVAHNEQYRLLIDGYMLRHKVKPGITGWAQINGWRGETDTLEKMQKRVDFDLEYIREWSIWFDLKIIFLTIFKGFVGKDVY
ncbi:putative colanic acid biosynthesis UDP-glucose lipid carrier transferase [Serratia fonticola]|jgi:putative colanic acid biosynthesis UDP-glucose lipid carrier transferase|uniref:Putative colanic acid biosynthesis UDP-glucose lipid carrier transferase n=1 Tax=Serratia fonticola TaxID=47917 RepID=A0A542D4Z8_SERFO|nr:undecaprenyl-phosphate glucose phosphotransferase [Serratia fonticola]TQI79817.1 putative colanic acid biosynthesis UDP-glucose lipid carrier transferase [Serratia fonticola]TQI98158.1 putative colanic acid biosynthesis UDP-glucose lipid carrier transferase [Serratia fonticola]TVZ67686.1 putative colanic acid biosynthesis UDP-glucose lipid carrier transferase [Serratia fonticola]